MMKPEQLRYSILKKAFSGQLVKCESKSDDKPKVKTVEYDETPFDIPDDWFWSNLGSCCDMYTGNSISESVKKAKYAGLKEGYDYIATKDVSFTHTIEYDNGVRIPVDDGFKIAYSGSVLMCIEGGSAGRKIGVLDRDVCFGNKLCSFNSTEIANAYIYYYLQSYEFKAFFKDNMSGIIGGVSIKKLKELPIPVPTVSEQKAIVKKIEELLPYVDRYAEAFEKLEKFNAKFPEDMKKSILQYAIQGKLVEQRPEEGNAEELYQQIQEEKQRLIKEGKIKKDKPLAEITEEEIPFEVPNGWKLVRLGHIAYKITDGTHKTPQYTDDGIKFISAKNLYNGDLNFSNCKYISCEEHKELYARCNPEKGDLLVSKSGSIGTVVIVNVDFEFSTFESLALIKYNQKLLDAKYLQYSLQNACNTINPEKIRGVAVKHLPIADLTEMIIPLPPLKEQHRIVSKIEELLPYCDRLVK